MHWDCHDISIRRAMDDLQQIVTDGHPTAAGCPVTPYGASLHAGFVSGGLLATPTPSISTRACIA